MATASSRSISGQDTRSSEFQSVGGTFVPNQKFPGLRCIRERRWFCSISSLLTRNINQAVFTTSSLHFMWERLHQSYSMSNTPGVWWYGKLSTSVRRECIISIIEMRWISKYETELKQTKNTNIRSNLRRSSGGTEGRVFLSTRSMWSSVTSH